MYVRVSPYLTVLSLLDMRNYQLRHLIQRCIRSAAAPDAVIPLS